MCKTQTECFIESYKNHAIVVHCQYSQHLVVEKGGWKVLGQHELHSDTLFKFKITEMGLGNVAQWKSTS